MFFNRLMVSIVAIPLLSYLVFYGDLSTFIVLEAAIFIMLMEFYRIADKNGIKANSKIGVISALSLPVVIRYGDEHGITFLLTLFTILFITRRTIMGTIKSSLTNVSYTIFGVLYIAFLFSHLLMIMQIEEPKIAFFGSTFPSGRIWLFLAFFIAFGSDSSAYIIGKLFGKTPLTSISPRKTVEGFFGSILFGFIASIAIKEIMFLELNCLQALFISVVGSIMAQLGDLGASLFKREFGVKDSGTILMSHGGILDRCDSVLFVAPFIFYCIKYIV